MKSCCKIKLFTGNGAANIIIPIASIVLIYLLVSIYFTDHFFFNTVINRADVSLKAHDEAEGIIRGYIKDYKLQLIERNGEVEEILGQDIGLQYNEENSIAIIYQIQNPLMWISSLFKGQKYYVSDLYVYNKDNLENEINGLNCLNKVIIEPQNVSFVYSNGTYEAVEAIYGNKIIKDRLSEAIKISISKGQKKLNLDGNLCYENPKFTLSSDKTPETKNLLDKYVKAKITYIFGSESETLDGNTINKWLSVDEDLEVVIDKKAVMEYVQGLSKKYDTVGAARNFKTSIGKIVEIKGGLYGWRINRPAEAKALIENIKLGEMLEKEPIYTQRALSRDENEIGNTYVEINITRQYLWYYKDGKLITRGAVVTGNPNKGYSTVLGTYMLNYKQKGATLVGPDYEAEVTFWMPFFGNIGIHDASWRYSFGGDVYKRNGTHGCVNVPFNLAKKIFDNIEAGTPIICYEE
ncbi:MAG: hypothetical protein APF77_20650 [Clostridia bacterium BRH_c25]|nr:MAG: hypothetical protein APF77_20650 [Clostridia bacterium BRH_c25]